MALAPHVAFAGKSKGAKGSASIPTDRTGRDNMCADERGRAPCWEVEAGVSRDQGFVPALGAAEESSHHLVTER